MHKKIGYIVSETGNAFYITESEKIDSLPAGCFSVEQDSAGTVFIQRITPNFDAIIDLPNSPLQSLIAEVNKFWGEASKYATYNMPHKRGILIYGDTAVGKTSLMLKLCESSIEHNSIVFFCNTFDTIEQAQILRIRDIEPDRPLVIVLEHLEVSAFDDVGRVNAALLDFINGISDIDHVLFIATTSTLQTLPQSIINRPSRFDLKVELTAPNAADREFYLKAMIPAGDIDSIDLAAWVKNTNGFTISHLKELITSYFIYDVPYYIAIKNIKKLSKAEKEIGFTNPDE